MKEFIFTKSVEEQIEDLKAQIDNLKEIKTVSLTVTTGNDSTVYTIGEDLEKISEVFGEDTEIILDKLQVDEQLQPKEKIIRVQF